MTKDDTLHAWKESAEGNLAIGKEMIEEYASWLIKQY